MVQKNADVWSEKVFNLEILDVNHMVKNETYNPCVSCLLTLKLPQNEHYTKL